MKDSMMGDMMKGFNPMDMCKCMSESITNTARMAAFATSEVQTLFEEWAKEVESEVLAILKKQNSTNFKSIAEELKISEDSVLFFITKLIRDKKIKIKDIEIV